MNDSAVTIRRNDISGYVSEHDTIELDDIRKISDTLNIPYETVRNDVKWLKKKENEIYKNYNLVGLRKKALNKIIQFEQMIKRIDDDILDEESDIDSDTLLKALTVKSQLLNNLHQLEHNGIGIVNMRIDDKK